MKTSQNSRSPLLMMIVIILALCLFVLGALWWFFQTDTSAPEQTISSYDQCVAAGYPVMESYPEQCNAGNGKTFTRDISNDVKSNQYTSEKGVDITVDTPKPGQSVRLPFTVSGKVPGNWTFEANFPIELIDKDGNSLVTMPVQVEGDWMTTDLVPFSVTFDAIESDYRGNITMVLRKDNPSGLPENDDAVSIDLVIQ